MRFGGSRIARARTAATTGSYDFLDAYVADLPSAIDLDAVAGADVRIGADPMGGASVAYWGEIADRYRLNLTVVNRDVDPTWRFMTMDWDEKIRTDCSSPYAMESLIARRDEFQVATGNDADADRHGIVTPDAGLMNPNHYLAAAIEYLYQHRTGWPPLTAIGKTLVSSSMIDRVTGDLDRRLFEVPVGFKWFVPGLLDGSIGFGGEESAGASSAERRVGVDDRQGRHPALFVGVRDHRRDRDDAEPALPEAHGAVRRPGVRRVDAPATPRKGGPGGLQPEQVTATQLAGEPITAKLTTAPGNHAIGGLKVTGPSSSSRPGPRTGAVNKIYAESWRGHDHLTRIQEGRDGSSPAPLPRRVRR